MTTKNQSNSRKMDSHKEAAQGWRKSSYCSGEAACVEVSELGVMITDSKQDLSSKSIITTTPETWNQLLDSLMFESSVTVNGLSAIEYSDQSASITDGRTTLRYTKTEWEAFTKAIKNNELYASSEEKILRDIVV